MLGNITLCKLYFCLGGGGGATQIFFTMGEGAGELEGYFMWRILTLSVGRIVPFTGPSSNEKIIGHSVYYKA